MNVTISMYMCIYKYIWWNDTHSSTRALLVINLCKITAVFYMPHFSSHSHIRISEYILFIMTIVFMAKNSICTSIARERLQCISPSSESLKTMDWFCQMCTNLSDRCSQHQYKNNIIFIPFSTKPWFVVSESTRQTKKKGKYDGFSQFSRMTKIDINVNDASDFLGSDNLQPSRQFNSIIIKAEHMRFERIFILANDHIPWLDA